ncbi:MAG: hypothetical protein JWR09_2702 [Mucilaginibacter sp.]|nr:hypothetical protein [Mucilaginibacter sp.]
MKKILTLLFLIICTRTFAQDSLKTYNYSRNHITITGMEVLGSWAIVNIGAGAAGWASSKGGSNKYFYQMSTIWGAANLGAALLGYTSAKNNTGKPLNAPESLKAQQKIEKIFLINGGLDLAYIGTGIFLKHRGDTRNSNQLRGYGSATIVQGVFLLLFDGTMYSTQRQNGNKLRQFLEKNPITFNGKTVGLIYNL